MSTPGWPACPDCGSDDTSILHEAKPSARATHATLRCADCDRVFKALVGVGKDVTVQTIISEGNESRRTTLPVPSTQTIAVEDELFGEDHRLLVTAIELADSRRVSSAQPEEIATLWCKVHDTVTIKISINRGNFTTSVDKVVPPETEFFVGDEMRIRGYPVVVHAIKTGQGTKHRGSAQARDIRRLYGRVRDDPLEQIREDERKERQRVHWERVARRRDYFRQREAAEEGER